MLLHQSVMGFRLAKRNPASSASKNMKSFSAILKALCLITLAFNITYGATYRTGVAEGSVTYSGGSSGSSSGGTNQTPWLSDIDGAGYSLTNAKGVSIIPTASSTGIIVRPNGINVTSLHIFDQSGNSAVSVNSNGVSSFTVLGSLNANTSIVVQAQLLHVTNVGSRFVVGGLPVTTNNLEVVGTARVSGKFVMSGDTNFNAGRSNWIMNVQAGRVFADFSCQENGLRTVWVTNNLVTTNSIALVSHQGTNCITGPLLPPLSCSAANGILKIHMSPASWNTVGNIATVSWFIANPGE